MMLVRWTVNCPILVSYEHKAPRILLLEQHNKQDMARITIYQTSQAALSNNYLYVYLFRSSLFAEISEIISLET